MNKALRMKLPNKKWSGVEPRTSKAMRKIRSLGNRSTELRLRMALVRAKISGWLLHPSDFYGKPDFVFPEKKLVVFVDGCFWHSCPKCGHIPDLNRAFWKKKMELNRERDIQVNQLLRNSGFHVIRFWEHKIKNEVSHCISRIQRSVPRKVSLK
jgi:DNA mismatch endonuclease (patch repair protein)